MRRMLGLLAVLLLAAACGPSVPASTGPSTLASTPGEAPASQEGLPTVQGETLAAGALSGDVALWFWAPW
ncbi:MAG: hypothetical protein ACR2MA_05275 [Egibacteraceae bacterium]